MLGSVLSYGDKCTKKEKKAAVQAGLHCITREGIIHTVIWVVYVPARLYILVEKTGNK